MLTPRDSSAPSRPGRSSAAGVVDFGMVPAGNYLLEASRWLSAAERAQLPAGQDVNGWVVREYVTVDVGAGQQSIALPASHRRSLVISEWAFNIAGIPGIGAYEFSGFLELYYNADTTVFLDGMLVGEGFNLAHDYPLSPCASNLQFTDNPLAVWTRLFESFPGRGRDYPIAPGQVVVVATDAIDHRPFFPNALDLSRADFEFSGPNDVDNPRAPNLVDIGLISHSFGHGLYFPGLGVVAILALPVDPGTLEVRQHYGTAYYAGIPRSRILDVLWIGSDFRDANYAECPRLVHAAFDRAASRARGTDEIAEYSYSLSRRVISGPFAGHRVLQHSRTGFADFVRTARTPGSLP
jgi:hypothetical protein